MTKRLRIFFQRRYTNDQQIHEKVLSIINHQGNTSQNHNEILLHIYKDVYFHKDKREQMLVRMGRKGNTYTVLVRIQNETATMENSLKVPQEIKNETTK